MRFGSQEAPQIARLNGSGRQGLTITELVLALIVLATLLAVAIPRVDIGLRRAHLQAASAELTTAHFLARTSAMRYGRPAELHIDAANGRFWVEVDTSVAGSGTKDTVGPVHRMADANITMTSTRSILCFDRRGLAYAFGTCQAPDALITFSLSGRTDTVQTTAIGKIIR